VVIARHRGLAGLLCLQALLLVSSLFVVVDGKALGMTHQSMLQVFPSSMRTQQKDDSESRPAGYVVNSVGCGKPSVGCYMHNIVEWDIG